MVAAQLDDSDTQPVSQSPPKPKPDPPDLDSPDPLLGQRIKVRYEILEVLGRGGMATVYLARDHDTGQKVVVKIPRSDVIDRFELEMVLHTEKVDHNHIVKIRDRGRVTVDGVALPFVVAEYKAGGDLSERLQGGARRADEVDSWLGPIARALDYSHSRGLVHRDVKPENILFDPEGFVFLSDFGIAKSISATATTFGAGSSATMQGTVIGTPGYIPPEAMNSVPTAQYDQFSLGVVVAQALTGAAPKRVFPTDTAHLLQKLPKRFHSVRQALSDEPSQRFPNCVAFAKALREEGSKGQPLLAWLGAAAAALIAIVVGFWAVANWTPVDDGSEPKDTVKETATVTPTPPGTPSSDSSPRRFELGSTSQEQERAVALCKKHVPGCDPAWYADEATRAVELAPFELDHREVTVAQFRKFVSGKSGYQTGAEKQGTSYAIVGNNTISMAGLSWSNPGWKAADDEPVVHVSRNDAAEYCSWAKGRLPTRDEWEAVARGSDRRVFPWGNEWDGNRARWRGGDSVRKPAPVAQFSAAPAQYFDLAGNVWEWTATDEDAKAVLKGGSWAETNPANLRSAAQLIENEDYTSEDAGFRCARDVETWPEP